ncbi:MAG TPA: right-handed parallel beta-helix repeat-containing protein, partial [Planctomycetota bacterium]|nr:right-handed parallel beta-helix repeat-containing protein [Planctomycetota bacterium]
ATFEEMKAKAPVYRHAVQVDPATLFASGVRAPDDADKAFDRLIDLRLRPGCSAIDAGEILPGWNDGFAGKAPDLGAYEVGQEPPRYGPRPEE